MAGRPKRRARPPTKLERQLLEHPPTKSTWWCQSEVCKPLKMTINGNLDECWLCGTPKGERPKLVWKEYVVACRKVGRDPEAPLVSLEKETTSESKPRQRRTTRKRVARR